MNVHLNTFIQLVSYIDYLNIWGRLAGYSLGLNSNNQNKTNSQSFLGRQCQARSLACSWGWPPRTPSSSPPPSSCSVGIFNLWIFLPFLMFGLYPIPQFANILAFLMCGWYFQLVRKNVSFFVFGIFDFWKLKTVLIFVDLWRFYKSLSYFANNGSMPTLFSTLSLLVAKCFVEGCNKRR